MPSGIPAGWNQFQTRVSQNCYVWAAEFMEILISLIDATQSRVKTQKKTLNEISKSPKAESKLTERIGAVRCE